MSLWLAGWLMTVLGMFIGGFAGSMLGVWCGMRMMIPTIKMLLDEK